MKNAHVRGHPVTCDPLRVERGVGGDSYPIRMGLSIGRLGHRMQMWRMADEIKERSQWHPFAPEGGSSSSSSSSTR